MNDNELQNGLTPSAGVNAACTLSDSALSAPSPPAPAPGSPPAQNATAKSGTNRGGAPRGNVSAAKTGHRGSKLPPKCRHEENLVQATVGRVLRELADKTGTTTLTAAQENLVAQIRRATERDRLAAKLLRNLKDLKGGELSHEQQVEQREVQAAALVVIEKCLAKLGLGIDHDDHDDPAASLARFANGTASPPQVLAAGNGLHSLANQFSADLDQSANQPPEVRQNSSQLRTEGIATDATDREPQEGQL